MKHSFINSLDARTARYVREALEDAETANPLQERFDSIERQTAEAAQMVKASADSDDAFAFINELSTYLAQAQTRAVEAQKLREHIKDRQEQVGAARSELQAMTQRRTELAARAHETLLAHEQARVNYDQHEFCIGVIERRIEQASSDVASLRRRLMQLKGQEVE